MQQVPKYLIIGNGRMASHFKHYLALSSIPYCSWHRNQNFFDESLESLISSAEIVLLLINDDHIENFYDENPLLKTKTCIHFSGSKYFKNILGIHPLNTFSDSLYAINEYKKIPMICDEGIEFHNIFPTLDNPVFHIPADKKAYYHSLCVMAGNFTTLLWGKLFKEFEDNLNFDRSISHPYMARIFENLLFYQKNALPLTGPLIRNDEKTITNNLKSLEDDDFLPIYKEFKNLYDKNKDQLQ